MSDIFNPLPEQVRPYQTVGDAWRARLTPFVGAQGQGVPNPFASSAVGAASPVTPTGIPAGITAGTGTPPVGSLMSGPAGPSLPSSGLPQRGIPSTLYASQAAPRAALSMSNPFGATVRGLPGTAGQMFAPSMPGGTGRLSMLRGVAGRGLGAYGIYQGLNMAGDMAGDNTSGDSLRAAALPGAATFAATGAAAPTAVAALGVGLGTAGATLIPGNENNSWSGVARNLGITEAGPLGDSLSELEAAGISPAGLAQIVQESESPEQAAQWLATELGRAGFEGASIEDGEVTVEGQAHDVITGFRQALEGGGDDLSGLIVDMAQSGASTDDVLAAVGAFEASVAAQEAAGGEVDTAAARADAQGFIEQTQAAAQAEADWFDRAAAYQAQVAEYLAPVTGQMRQQADAQYAAQEAMISGLGLPPEISAGMLMQADANRQTQVNTANAYQAQLHILPQQIAQQEFQTQQDAIAAQLMQSAIQGQITAAADPYAGMVDPMMQQALAMNPYGG